MPAATPPFQRLLSGYTENEATGCWDWNGLRGSSGYGMIKVFGKFVSTHRYSYELHKGHIPDGLQVMHSCDNKICINPDHLAVGTHKQNMRDAGVRGLMASGKNHFMAINGNPNKGIKNKQSIPCLVLGKYYGSINEAEIDLGLGNGTVRFWIKNHPHKAKEISREEYINNA